jgi:hypothetical protein
MLKTLSTIKKQNLARKTKLFTLKDGIFYWLGQDNKLHKCVQKKPKLIFENSMKGLQKVIL